MSKFTIKEANNGWSLVVGISGKPVTHYVKTGSAKEIAGKLNEEITELVFEVGRLKQDKTDMCRWLDAKDKRIDELESCLQHILSMTTSDMRNGEHGKSAWQIEADIAAILKLSDSQRISETEAREIANE